MSSERRLAIGSPALSAVRLAARGSTGGCTRTSVYLGEPGSSGQIRVAGKLQIDLGGAGDILEFNVPTDVLGSAKFIRANRHHPRGTQRFQ